MNCLDCEQQRTTNSNIVWLDLTKFKRPDVYNKYKPVLVCGQDGTECKEHNYYCSSFTERKRIETNEHEEDDYTEEDWEEHEVEGLHF